MCKENCTEINLSSSVFNEMRDNFGENEGQLKPKFKHQLWSRSGKAAW